MEIVSIVNQEGVRKYGQGFVDVYQKAFAEPPYNEVFSEAECLKIFKNLIENGHCFLAVINGKVVGLYGGIPLIQEEKVIPVLRQYREMELEEVFYIAEIATHPEYWKQGIGSAITKKSLKVLQEEGKYNYVLIRTLNTGAQKIYERNGFVIIPEMTQSVMTKVKNNGSWVNQEQERFFLEKYL